MNTIDTPEFRELMQNFGSGHETQTGMSLRDYFAGQAMQGFLAGSLADGTGFTAGDEDVVAKFSYRIADAMLAERAK